MARSLVILADGLRPDAVTPRRAPHMTRIARAGTIARSAHTVRPSVTVAALTSLATGVPPQTHGLVQPGLGFLKRLPGLRPLGRELHRHCVPSIVVTGALSSSARPIAWALATCAGVTRIVPAAAGADSIAEAALAQWDALAQGLLFVYFPDCDVAGHATGWMSPAYYDAVAAVDAAAGRLAAAANEALLVVVADHGGGGVTATDHDAPHPVNDAIPLIMRGFSVRRGHVLEGAVSILDLPPTLLQWFGAPIPECYEGRVLSDAFMPLEEAVLA